MTALAAAVPYEDIAEDLGISRERVRQRQERAIKATAYVNVLPGYRAARDHAQEQLACLITADDSAVESRHLNAITVLSFPTADNALVTRLITHAAVQAVLRRTGTPQGHDMGAPP